MDIELRERTALVAAGSAGIGKAIATGLASHGAQVCIFARTEATLEAASREMSAAGMRVMYAVGDLGDPADVARVAAEASARLGPIDILVNNQGGPPPGTFDDVTVDQVRRAFAVNVESVLQLTRLCLPSMRERGWGRILNILSVTAKEPAPGLFLSNLVRPAVLGFAKTVARENAAFGITVNSLLPASVLTKRARDLLGLEAERKGITLQEAIDDAARRLPIGRIAAPEEFAEIALFLCSSRAAYVTGTAIPVDGGATHTLF